MEPDGLETDLSNATDEQPEQMSILWQILFGLWVGIGIVGAVVATLAVLV